jgi:hypothetical protein
MRLLPCAALTGLTEMVELMYAVSTGKNGLIHSGELELNKCEHIQNNPEFFSYYGNEVISKYILSPYIYEPIFSTAL